MRAHVFWLTLLCCLTSAIAADADRDKHKFRLGVNWISSTGGFSTGVFNESFFFREQWDTNAEGGSSIGLQAAYEFRPIGRLGLALGVENTTVDVGFTESFQFELLDFFTGEFETDTARIGADGELDMTPITLGVHWYLTPGRPYEFYVGPVVGYVLYDELKEDSWVAVFEDMLRNPIQSDARSIELDDDTAFGAVIGLDLDIGDGAGSFHIAVGYLDASADPKDPEVGITVDVDPIIVRAGAVFRF